MKNKGKSTLHRLMLSVDLAAGILVNLLLLLQPSGACKRGEACDF